jgi:pectinesterase
MNRSSVLAVVALGFSACTSATNGRSGSGGSTSTGGIVATGGSIATGGTTTTRGTVTTGGTASTGGTIATGGTSAAGGAIPAGGTTPIGGTTATGGATGAGGGTAPTGGTAATGGTTPTGGTTSAGGGTTGTSGGTTVTGGTSAAGGMTVTGGTTGTGGATSTGGGTSPAVTCTAQYTGSETRPLLTDASAACFTMQNYLAQAGPIGALLRDNWDPSAGLPDASTYTPTYTVAADGSGTHTTVQSAITAANSSGGSPRVYILVQPGTYRELICVKGSVPITLYGADTDATKVTIAFDNYNGKTVDSSNTNACAAPSGATYGTSGSSTFFSSATGFQAQNLTIANDFVEGTLTSNIQAVALTVQGDQQVFQNVSLIGNQDTLQVKSSSATVVARSYFKDSYIEGDTDFIFGRGTAVFDGCTITYVSGRKTNSTHIAPSTETPNPFGFLIINSKMVGDSGMPTGTAYLGRAWDDSSGTAPNGQAVIRNTEIGGHINIAAPWAAAATSNRAFTASGNRLYEYQNTGAGAAPGGAPVDAGSPD